MEQPTYLKIADEIAADISAGILREGERLPPYREIAYDHGIASSTASRIYEELIRRGLVLGEIGRGTFVRPVEARRGTTLVEPVSVPIDLEHNYSVRPSHEKKIAKSLSEIGRNNKFSECLTPLGTAGKTNSRKVACRYLRTENWAPKPERVLFSGSGRQAIIATLSAITKPGDRIGVETVTYPVFIGIAQKLGLVLVPIEMDKEGITPNSLLQNHQKHRLQALYIQPSLQSPTGFTMSEDRRKTIAKIINDQSIPTLEDGIYNFLANDLPLCALAPEQIIYIDSLSKSIAPGLSLGIIYSPARFHQSIEFSLRYGAWTAHGLLLALGTYWMESQDLKKIIKEKRNDAQFRQKVARKIFSNYEINGDTRAYHLWLPLPEGVKGEDFAAHMLKMGIAITAGNEFSTINGITPNFIRISLASPEQKTLTEALKTINTQLTSFSK